MLDNQLKAFMVKVQADKTLQEQLEAEGSDPIAIAREAGFEVSKEAITAWMENLSEEDFESLSDEDLNAVSGGARGAIARKAMGAGGKAAAKSLGEYGQLGGAFISRAASRNLGNVISDIF